MTDVANTAALDVAAVEKAVAKHRDVCLVGERRQAVGADLRSMAGEAEGAS